MRKMAATLAVVGALLFSAGSAQGYAPAQYDLGVSYAEGEGVPENDAEAVKWFSRPPSRVSHRPSSILDR